MAPKKNNLPILVPEKYTLDVKKSPKPKTTQVNKSLPKLKPKKKALNKLMKPVNKFKYKKGTRML